ncbi:hypothetical protein L1887_03359 [Cichorium endivia]|nr:hypothetical protein L1887_03359 [Cichorium endivia]
MLTSYYKSIGISTHTVMAKIIRTVVFNSLFLTLLLCSWWAQISCSSIPAGEYCDCQKYKEVAKELLDQVDKQADTKKISKDDIIEISKNVCNLKKQGDKLKPVEQDSEGKRGSECKAIRTYEEAIRPGVKHVAEYIYKEKPQLDSLIEFLCKGLTATSNKVKNRRENEKNKDNDLTHKIMGGIMDVGSKMTDGIVGCTKAAASQLKKLLKKSDKDDLYMCYY